VAAGRRQQRKMGKPYQQARYWSTVPFLHGADQAVKYSAIPAPANAGRPLHDEPNALRDELLRHLAEDSPASFDFAIQLLDTERMTWKGERRDPPFWVENASAEWNETEAPFHVVGQLRLLPASQLSDE